MITPIISMPRLCQTTKNYIEHESDSEIIVIGVYGMVSKGLVKELEDLEIKGQWRPSGLQHY